MCAGATRRLIVRDETKGGAMIRFDISARGVVLEYEPEFRTADRVLDELKKPTAR